jgi:hypothetical protein
MRRRSAIPSLAGTLIAALLLFACVQAAFADGGRIRFREPAGPFVVTLFTTPDPLTLGPADFSVAVERVGAPGLVEDAQVQFILTPADHHGSRLVLDASRAAATSKWLQAANFRLPAQGLWRVTVVVRRGQQVGQCSGAVRVRAAGTRNLVWDVLPVPLLGLSFLLHQWRKRAYKRQRVAAASTTHV